MSAVQNGSLHATTLQHFRSLDKNETKMSAPIQRAKAIKKQKHTDTTFVIKWPGPVLQAVAENEQEDVSFFGFSLE